MKTISFILSVAVALASCYSSSLYQKEDIIKFEYDSSGVMTARTFRKVISWPSGDKLATITEEFDTAGRVKVRYGYDHPDLGKKFMVRYNYLGDFERVVTHFSWDEELHDSSFADYSRFFSSQRIYSPGEPAKTIQILIHDHRNDTLKGGFSLTNHRTGIVEKSFEFTLPTSEVEFDKHGMLKLRNISDRF